jgi:hypothetical protein
MTTAVEDFLDLARIDVKTAKDDERLFAIDDVEITVLIDPAEVSAGEPAIGRNHLRCVGWLIPVSLHDVVATDLDFADVACVKPKLR